MQGTRYNRKNRRKYLLKAHLVLVTKYRKKLLTGDIDATAKKCIADTAKRNGWDIVAMETDKDHVHILLSYDATDRICDIVKVIKQTTTYQLWENYGSLLQKHYWKQRIFWSDGYFACSIGDVSSATVEKYIAEQG